VDDFTYQRVVQVLNNIAGVPEERLAPEARLDSLGLDSLALLEIGLALQTECGVEIDDGEVARAGTVADLVRVVHSS
jgi:acyl carrier protein